MNMPYAPNPSPWLWWTVAAAATVTVVGTVVWSARRRTKRPPTPPVPSDSVATPPTPPPPDIPDATAQDPDTPTANQPGLGICKPGYRWGYDWSEYVDGDGRTRPGGHCFDIHDPTTLDCPNGKVQARVTIYSKSVGGAGEEILQYEDRCVAPARRADGSLDTMPHERPR